MLDDYCMEFKMNDRIKELMNEAVRFHWDHDGQAYEAQVHPEDLEYFAELIVRECCQKLENDGMVEVAMEMKQHFGVNMNDQDYDEQGGERGWAER